MSQWTVRVSSLSVIGKPEKRHPRVCGGAARGLALLGYCKGNETCYDREDH